VKKLLASVISCLITVNNLCSILGFWWVNDVRKALNLATGALQRSGVLEHTTTPSGHLATSKCNHFCAASGLTCHVDFKTVVWDIAALKNSFYCCQDRLSHLSPSLEESLVHKGLPPQEVHTALRWVGSSPGLGIANTPLDQPRPCH
jgi:hypothetical protein